MRVKTYPQLKRLFAVSFLLLCLAAFRHLGAHGIGTPQRINVPSGPYLVSIWTDPDPLRVDETHVVVAVMEPETQRPLVENVAVTVTLVNTSDPSQSVTGQADSSISTNQLLHAIEFNGRVRPGTWDGIVSVVGPSGPGEPLSFQVEVLPGESTNWLGIGAAIVGLAIVGWLILSLRQAPKDGESRRRRHSD